MAKTLIRHSHKSSFVGWLESTFMCYNTCDIFEENYSTFKGKYNTFEEKLKKCNIFSWKL